jgi:HK97 family phage major capsid protein
MTLREQLKALEDSKSLKIKRLGELSEIVKGGTAGASENDEIDTLTGEIEKLDTDIRMKKVEVMTCDSASPVTPSTKTAPNIITHKSDPDEKFKGQAFTRMVIAKAVGQLEGISPLVIAEKRWGRSNPMLVSLIKTAVAGGGSGSSEWGAELVAADARFTGDFIEYLNAMTVFDRLGLREVPANVTIKGQDGAATGYWVGQSKPIPASAQSFSTVSLTPLKVAALAVVSNELLRDSTPAAEQLVRDAIVEACSQKIDTTFFSTAAISAGVSPAGILNGLAAGSSAGVDADGLRADIKALYASFIAAKNASGLKLVMNPALAKAIQLLTNALGMTEFPGITQNGGTLLGDTVVTGDNINANHIILLKPTDIYRIADTGIQVSISREAMIEMDDSPTGASDTPAGASTAMVSMFQSESTALKVVRPVNFQIRRAGAVAYISDADYGAVSS